MANFIQIQWTAENIEEAHEICRALVEKRLVACAQILPGMESIYLWKDKVMTSSEVKVCLKTINQNFQKVEELILERSSYEIPEILMVEISGSAAYLDWLENVLNRPFNLEVRQVKV